jgi:hypothetical protein
MKETPMLFSGAMVRAILAGRKSQTRRVVKPVPKQDRDEDSWFWQGGPRLVRHGYGAPYVHTNWDACRRAMELANPYGNVGDRIWVKETHYWDICEPFPKTKPENFPMDFYYRADGECCKQIPECQCADVGKPKWRPSIFMPRWASRITLEITGVRVERLQEISVHDAFKEGIYCPGCHSTEHHACIEAVTAYRALWETINGPGSWAKNPWVWVLEFKKL